MAQRTPYTHRGHALVRDAGGRVPNMVLEEADGLVRLRHQPTGLTRGAWETKPGRAALRYEAAALAEDVKRLAAPAA
jgi:hypothetical protein